MGIDPPKDQKPGAYGEWSLGFVTYPGLLNRHDLYNMRGPLIKKEVANTLKALCRPL